MSKGYSGLFEGRRESGKIVEISSDARKISAAPAETEPSDSGGEGRKGLSNYQKRLIKEVQARGDKITPENVIDIGRNKDGRIIWIETGNDDAGLKHILKKHGKQFKNKGFNPLSLSRFIVRLALTGKPIGQMKTGNPTPREVYKISIGGSTKYIAMTIGSNGFIVGINFVTERNIVWKKQ